MMKKKSKSQFWIYFIPILLIACCGIFMLLQKSNENIKEEKKDSIRIKEEYEELNNNYSNVSLGEENVFVYADLNTIKDLFNGKDGIIYIGTPSSYSARKTISILNEVVNTTSIEKIYYIDTKNMDSDLNILLLNKLNIIKINPATIVTVQGGSILNNYSLYHKLENKNEISEEEKENVINEYKNILRTFVEACDENC